MGRADIEARLEAEIAIAKAAGALAMRYFDGHEHFRATLKGHQDVVTDADKAVEAFIAGALSERFPDDGVLGEEGGGRVGERVWVIDPIDGTANFARRVPTFGISIAFVARGTVELGVISEPTTGTIYSCRRHGGAFRDGVAIGCAHDVPVERSIIDYHYAKKRAHADNMSAFSRLYELGFSTSQIRCASLALARVAEGRLDGFCSLHLESWDVLAGNLLVAEAGGWVKSFPMTLTTGGEVLACRHELAGRLIGGEDRMRDSGTAAR
jgi:myo-inositol-1(or 4)-monophosphatase